MCERVRRRYGFTISATDLMRFSRCSAGNPASVRSSSRRRFFSASLATVFEVVLADSRMRFSSKNEFVPPDLSSLEYSHSAILFFLSLIPSSPSASLQQPS